MNKQPDTNLMEYILNLLNFLCENDIEPERLMEKGVAEFFSFPDSPNIRAACEMIKFMDEMPGGFLIYHADNTEKIIYANKALLRIFQCNTMREFREYTGNSFKGIVHPEDLGAVEQSIEEQIAGSQYDLDYVEYRIIRKDGEIRWIEDYGHYVYGESIGNIFYVFLGDATEKRNRHLVEKALLISEKEQQEKKLHELIEEYDRERSMLNQEHLRRLEVIEGLSVNYESILYADLETDIILPYRLSERTEKQFGEQFQERKFSWYVSDYVNVWVHPEDRERLAKKTSAEYIRQKLSMSSTYYINYRVVKDGKTQFLQLRIVNAGRNERISQIVMGYRRVDEELQRELEQKQLLTDALENANLAIVAKNTFLSNMSHDMRTPLNAIFGFTELAKKHVNDTEKLLNYLDRIDISCGQLLDLIDKVLEISWTESKETSVVEAECNICDILQEVHNGILPLAAEKNITFSLNCDGIEHCNIYSDYNKLKQVISYLADNAVTYTEPGGTVSVSAEEKADLKTGYAEYRIVVKDSGIGIGREFLENLFDPFAREKNTTFSGVHGTGLGLTIAKSIVDRMGGTIEVNSAVGKGSTFVVTLRFRIESKPQDDSTSGMQAEDKPFIQRLLLVEDNEINMEIETEILHGLGFYVETASDGSVAVEKVKQSAPGDYDLILMDIQMPTMDGWQAARAIRCLENPVLANIPIIALSANVFESDMQTSIESGMNAHLSKPINIPHLIKTIEDIAQKKKDFS
uniref:histidine kinase n=1 Tax=uncultured Bacillota bacterium TaxID=344338 RepID=A0A650F4M8_9FIRM|nr:hypothetical protein Firmicute1046_1310 [uncultured Firmicutes bacterium]